MNWAGCVKYSADLAGAELAEANLTGATLIGADLSGANLFLANLTGAILIGADLSGADLTLVRAEGADLTGANLSGSNVSGLRARGANLEAVDLRDAGGFGFPTDLQDVNLTGADLARFRWVPPGSMPLSLDRAVLVGANLTDSVWQFGSMREARIDGADLTRTTVRSFDLTGLTGTPSSVTDLEITGAICPDGVFQPVGCTLTP